MKHRDLLGFLRYVEKGRIDIGSTVYKGTLYEYVTQKAMEARFRAQGLGELARLGGVSDKGVDLLGVWQGARVIVQCKCWRQKVGPAMIHEIAGAHSYHHKGSPTLMVLATPTPLTASAVRAFQVVETPMMHCQVANILPKQDKRGGLRVEVPPSAVLAFATNAAARELFPAW